MLFRSGLDVQSLPPQYRDFFKNAVKNATPTVGNDREAVPSHLQNISNPLSVLVGAGILSRRGLLRSQDIDMATDAASSQGWRRPLLAWLGLQLQAAKVRGDNREAAAIERRISLVTQQP